MDAGRLPDLAFLSAHFGPSLASVPLIDVVVVPPCAYDKRVAVVAVKATLDLQVAA